MRKTIADIPWPGPRPLSFEEANGDDPLKMLVGRGRELDELLHFCQTYSVIELTAPSGVGKTSFVAAAKPRLERAGGKIVAADPWPDVTGAFKQLGEAVGDDEALTFYCLALGIPVCADAAELYEALGELGDGKPLVCVFDQLEELLRYENPIGTKLLRLIGRTAADTGVPHVVIARSEVRDELRPVEMRGSPTWHMLLSEIEDRQTLKEIVTVPVPEEVVLDDEAVEALVGWWEGARELTAPPERTPLTLRRGMAKWGLLHFQALLWSLRRWATEEENGVDLQHLTLQDLGRYARQRDAGLEPGHGAHLMGEALRSYVDHAVDSSDGNRWPNGPRLMFAHAIGNLSAAGFKVPQSAPALIARALQDELGSSKSGQGLPTDIDLTSATGRELATKELAGRFQVDGAGIAREWTPHEVTEEMIVSLELALKWLAGKNLLRQYQHQDSTVYELVHDAFAPALAEWASGVLGTPLAIMGGVSARRGEVFDYGLGPQVFLDDHGEPHAYWSAVEATEIGGERAARVIGAKWLGLGVHRLNPADRDVSRLPIRFERIVFDDCSFMGTLFEGISFRNVEFRNCEMRGVAMIGCQLENVVFSQCDLTGAAMVKCAFGEVIFEGKDRKRSMNYVSIEDAAPDAVVDFRDLEEITGLFLVNLRGGKWRFERPEISHLSLSSEGGFDLELSAKETRLLTPRTLNVPDNATVHIDPVDEPAS